MKKRLFSIAAAVCAALLPAASQAKDEWPTDTVKIIVPFTAVKQKRQEAFQEE